jgi:phage-related protein
MSDYKVKYYKDSINGKKYVYEYIEKLDEKDKAKVFKYIQFLKDSEGYLDEPYSRHIRGKIRELRVDFSKNKHRIFYFASFGKTIILLNAFLKKTKKTPKSEIEKAIINYKDALNNINSYE